MINRLTATLCLAFAATFAAHAEDCQPLKLVASVQLVPDESGRAYYIPVEIAGVPKLMLLDTAAAITVISEAAAKELKLDTYQAEGRLYNVTGTYTDRHTIAPLKIGALKGKIDFMVDPHLNGGDPNVIGLLGGDILSHYDVSVDFGTNKMDLLDPDHCEGKVVYWKREALAVIPFKKLPSTAVVVTVELDGKSVKAILDTGASNSTIHIDAAEKLFAIKPGDADTPAIGGLNDRKDLTTYSHRFKTLAFDGVAVTNPEIVLIPDKLTETIGSRIPTNSHITEISEDSEPDVLLGMNVLRHMHIYLAYKERRLYITPAGSPSSQTSP